MKEEKKQEYRNKREGGSIRNKREREKILREGGRKVDEEREEK